MADEFTLSELRGSTRRNRIEGMLRRLFGAAASLSIVISVAIVGVLVVRGLGFLVDVPLKSLLDPKGWNPRNFHFDLLTVFMGSLWVTLIALAVATPIGIGLATFLSEYAPPGVRRILKPAIEVLAGLPSVVVAYFMLYVFHPAVLSSVVESRYSLLAAGIGVGILTVPIIATVSEDALASVPRGLREASVGLGARKVTTSVRVVLPAALSGIIASFIIGASRALGETMLVTLVAGGASGAPRTFSAGDQGLTMTSAMVNLAVGTDNVTTSGGGGFNPVESLYLVGILLFLFTLALNMLGGRLVRKYRQGY